MATGRPAQAAIELYSRLIRLPYGRQDDIARIEWELRKQRMRHPGDLLTMVSLLESLIMQGKAGEAIRLADDIWQRHHALAPGLARIHADQLIALGCYDHCRQLLLPRPDPTSGTLVSLAEKLFACAMGAGDVTLLERLALLEQASGHRSLIAAFLAELERTGLRSHFARHQQIIRDLTFGRQAGITAFLVEPDGPVELAVYVYAKAGLDERRQLEETIDDALDGFYGQAGVDAALAAARVTVQVLDVTAQPTVLVN